MYRGNSVGQFDAQCLMFYLRHRRPVLLRPILVVGISLQPLIGFGRTDGFPGSCGSSEHTVQVLVSLIGGHYTDYGRCRSHLFMTPVSKQLP